MLGIASSVTDSTATAGTRILASRQTMCGWVRIWPQPWTAGGRERPRPRISPKVISERIGHAKVRFFMLLPGTQNEYESVTFGEDEQPVVGVHADVMVFTVTA